MKKIYTFLLMICGISLAQSQTVDQPSVGAGYMNATYYHLEDGSTTSVAHEDWDIAFSVGSMDLGIFINEGIGLSFTTPLTSVELYQTSSTDFTNLDTAGMSRIYNDEVSWSSGAFNHVANSMDPSDYGWGSYDFMTHVVNGSRVFVVKLRNGNYKKLEIQSLASGVYTFRFADLDGGNEISETIDKADYQGKTLVYYSIENEAALDLEPVEWDMVFTRYVTSLDDGAGGTIDYTVTGVLSNKGVTVVQVDGIDPSSVNYIDYADDYNDTLTVIGHDWKSYQGAWVIEANRVYFVKTAEGEIWKVQFYDFEGSTTGVSTLEKTKMEDPNSTNELEKEINSFNVFPNPATDMTNLVFDVKSLTGDAQIHLYNQLGQKVMTRDIDIHEGLNSYQMPLSVSSGLYQVAIQVENNFITRSLLIQ